MVKTFNRTVSGVHCTTDNVANHLAVNYIELTSTVEDMGNYINFTGWFHFHEPWGYNCWGVSYMWYIVFYDKNGNEISRKDITPTNVSGYAARLFYFPANSSSPAEHVLDRYANDSTPTRRDVFINNGLTYNQEASRCAQNIQLRTPDNTAMQYTLWKSDIPNGTYAYGNLLVFAQYLDSSSGSHPVQDPTLPGNQFSSYAIPEGNIAINDDSTIIDNVSRLYVKNGTWQNNARIWHRENNIWVKKYLYKKINGTWTKIP